MTSWQFRIAPCLGAQFIQRRLRLRNIHLNGLTLTVCVCSLPTQGAGAATYVWTSWKTRHPYTRTRTPHRRDAHPTTPPPHSPLHTIITQPSNRSMVYLSRQVINSADPDKGRSDRQHVMKRDSSLTKPPSSLSFSCGCCTVSRLIFTPLQFCRSPHSATFKRDPTAEGAQISLFSHSRLHKLLKVSVLCSVLTLEQK